MFGPGMLASVNHLHETGRQERRSIAWEAALIFGGGLVLYVMLVLLVSNPGFASAERSSEAFSKLSNSLNYVALDAAGMAQFVAVAGVVLALNRLDRHSPDELGADDAVRLWTRLEYRSILQFLLTLTAATAPYRSMSWILLHYGEADWHKKSMEIAGACTILWLLLLVAGPMGRTFGLHVIQRQWQLRDIVYRAGRLEHVWGNRWGLSLDLPPLKSGQALRITLNWAAITTLSASTSLLVTALTYHRFPFEITSSYWQFLFMLWIYFSFVGLFVLVLAVSASLMALRTSKDSRSKATTFWKFAAIVLPFGFAAGSVWVFARDYLPVTVPVLVMGAAQYACVQGILRVSPLQPRAWDPIRNLVLAIRTLSHQRACTNWQSLKSQWDLRLDHMSRRESRKARKEAQHWRKKHNLTAPFLD